MYNRATAQVMGNIAFKNGVKCAPCLDADLMTMIKNNPDKRTGSSLPMLNGWLDGWTQANLYGDRND